jgi:hypothetical protein
MRVTGRRLPRWHRRTGYPLVAAPQNRNLFSLSNASGSCQLLDVCSLADGASGDLIEIVKPMSHGCYVFHLAEVAVLAKCFGTLQGLSRDCAVPPAPE